jgi:hypothetical protein
MEIINLLSQTTAEAIDQIQRGGVAFSLYSDVVKMKSF